MNNKIIELNQIEMSAICGGNKFINSVKEKGKEIVSYFENWDNKDQDEKNKIIGVAVGVGCAILPDAVIGVILEMSLFAIGITVAVESINIKN